MNHFLLCTVAVLVNTCFLTADTIHLVNGDRLSGEIQSLASANFTFQTAYAGTLEIAWDQIQALSAESPLIVEMDGGVSARGLLSSPEPGTLQIDSNPPIPFAQIVAIYKDANIPNAPRFLEFWNGSANLGYTLVRGNTTIDNLTFNFNSARQTDADRIRILAQSLYSAQDGAEASSMHSAQGRYDRFLNSRVFFFIHGIVETDERAKLDLRTSEGGGFGLEFELDPMTQLSLFGGLTFLQENFEGLDRTLSAEAITGLEFESARFEPFIIGTLAQLLPILTDSRYRVRWSANLRIPLFAGFNLGLQMFDNFDSDPPQVDVRKNDFGIVSTVGYAF